MTNSTRRRILAVLSCAILAPACGGGGGGGAATITVSGKAVKGVIMSGNVEVYTVTPLGALGTLLGSGTTSATGDFSVSVAPQSGPVAVRVFGAAAGVQYQDEAAGGLVGFVAADVLLAYRSSASTNVTIHVTPLTHWAARRVQLVGPGSGLPMATFIDRINTYVATQFGLTDILGVTPVNLTDGTADSSGTEATHYGLVLAGFAKEAQTATVGAMALVNAITSDVQGDGVFDGLNSGGAVVLGAGNLSTTASTTALGQGMTDFLNSGVNTSGISAAAESTFITPINGGSAPVAPTGLAGVGGNTTVTLTWNAVPGARSYNVYMATVSGVTQATWNGLAGGMAHATVGSPFFHAGLPNGVAHYFVVTAVNLAGQSGESTEVVVTPIP